MKITYLHQYFNTPWMVGASRSYYMARRLTSLGHEVNVVTSWRDAGKKAGWFETEEEGVRVHWLPVRYTNSMGATRRIHAFLDFAVKSTVRAARIQADVVFATSTPLTISIPGAIAAYCQKCPFVFETRDLWPDVPIALGYLRNPIARFMARGLERFSYAAAESIVALTPTMRDYLSGKGVPLESIFVVSNGADLASFPASSVIESHAPEEAREMLLLYCGSLGPAHGPAYLLGLAREIARRGIPIRIVVVGDGGMKEELVGRARTDGSLDKTISFVGAVPQREVADFYRRAAASIMTMAPCELLYRHSVQNKFFDSLAASTPVFSNYRGWSMELAEQESVGVVLPQDDFAAAVDLLQWKLGDREWLESARSRARALAEHYFGWDNLGSALSGLLVAAVERRSPGFADL